MKTYRVSQKLQEPVHLFMMGSDYWDTLYSMSYIFPEGARNKFKEKRIIFKGRVGR